MNTQTATPTAREIEFTALDWVDEFARFIGDTEGDEAAKEITSLLAVLPDTNRSRVLRAMSKNGRINDFIGKVMEAKASHDVTFETAWGKMIAKTSLPTEYAQWVKADWETQYALMLDDYGFGGSDADDEEAVLSHYATRYASGW